MILLIFALIFGATSAADVVTPLAETALAPSNEPMKITRVHLNPEEDELFKEYIYKDGYNIRIDVDYGNSSYTSLVYDGKNGYINGGMKPANACLEVVLFGRRCGYLTMIEEVSDGYYDGRTAILATGKQGNRLYLNAATGLPMRFEWSNETVDFEEYNDVQGFGSIPFLIIRTRDQNVEIIRITGVQKPVKIPKNFFSVPTQEENEENLE
jgi:hypothetical protein